jgi:Centromere protein M (CENP-M)
MIDMKNQKTLQAVLDATSTLHAEYILSKSCIVVTNAQLHSTFAFPLEDLRTFTFLYDSSPYFCDMNSQHSIDVCATSICQLAYHSHRTPTRTTSIGSTMPLSVWQATDVSQFAKTTII